jgi:choline dehydrogenase-like flavoprotein
MEADVVIVGAGAGGAACAWALASRGVRVLLLESGEEYLPARDNRLHLADWEQNPFPDDDKHTLPYRVGLLQPLPPQWDQLRSWSHVFGRGAGANRRAQKYHHVRAVGGSTLHFSGEAHRLNPAAMQMHTRFAVAADWPLTYEQLEPFYVMAEQQIGVAGDSNDPLRPRSRDYPLPAHGHSYASQKIGLGCRKLGMSWTANPLAILSRPWHGRPACNYCGQCARGCPRGDKGTADLTFVAPAIATGNCVLRSACHVSGIKAGGDDRVAQVRWIDAQGSEHAVAPRVLIIACGAVQTPRLLLSVSDAATPHGLANESGQVGRNFMETLAWSSSALHPEALGSHRGVPVDGICWDFNAPDALPGVPGGVRFNVGMAEADLAGPINYARRVVSGWGHAHRANMKKSFGHVLSVGSVGEFLPNDGSYIDLDPGARDQYGQPVARIFSRVDEPELRRLDFMAGKCREILAAAGCDKPFEEFGTYDTFSATHVFGSCRMGRDARSSVVDENCRSHRWRNLFIADASVFPSSGGGESPSLTIAALAIRVGAHVRDRLAAREL